MACIMWSVIKNKLILPYLGTGLKHYDLSMKSQGTVTWLEDRPYSSIDKGSRNERDAWRCKHVGSRNRLDEG
jgi:hypothetical protein